MNRSEKRDPQAAWGGPGVEQVREAVRQALAEPSLEGERRAFAVADLTCVVQWEPAERRGGGRGFHEVNFRLRRGDRRKDLDCTLSDLSMLARTCEHHLLFFLRSSGHEVPERPAVSAGREPAPLSAADRLRALLHQGSHQGS